MSGSICSRYEAEMDKWFGMCCGYIIIRFDQEVHPKTSFRFLPSALKADCVIMISPPLRGWDKVFEFSVCPIKYFEDGFRQDGLMDFNQFCGQVDQRLNWDTCIEFELRFE